MASPPSPFSCPPHGPDMSRSGPLEGADGGGDPRPGEPFCPGGGPSSGPPEHRPCPGPSLADDTDANSNGSSGNESNGPESRGASQRSSHSSSSGNGKDSALLETTESSKRCVWMGVAGSGSGLWNHLSWETGPSCWPLSPHRGPVASPLARTLRAHPHPAVPLPTAS